MPAASRRPVLFLDVDGTLIPTGGVELPGTVEEWDAQWQSPSNARLASIETSHGRRLRTLPCDLVWATAWQHDANRVIAPILGLPELQVPDLGELPNIDDPIYSETDASAALNWKTPGLVRFAAGRPFVWLDDELTGVDRDWVATHHPGRALLHRVDAGTGVTERDLEVVAAWLLATDSSTRASDRLVEP